MKMTMKKISIFLFLLLSVLFDGYTQIKSVEAASIYMTTVDPDSSAAFYAKLGFAKIGSNEFPSPWVQVTDGSLLITLRKDTSPFIGVTYYIKNLKQAVDALEKDSIVFVKKPLPGDPIQRYYLKTPEGFNIVLSGNPGGFKKPTGPTLLDFKPADFNNAGKYPNKQCGVFGEFAHPVSDLKQSMAFWKKLGFTVKSVTQNPYPFAILSDGWMIIGLHQTDHFHTPAITYFGLETAKRIAELKTNGLKDFKEVAGKNNVDLKTWEGQHFFLFNL
jgi:hypothetical protein